MQKRCRIEMPNERVNAEIHEKEDVCDTMTLTANKQLGETRAYE